MNEAADRPRFSDVPFLLPFAREVRRAVDGEVPGFPRLKPLPFPKRLIARQRLMRGMSSFVAAAQRNTEEERIRFARKLAVHIIRDNWQPIGSDIILGVQWFAAHRAALSSRISLSGAIRLQKIRRKRDLDQQMKTAMARWHAALQVPDEPMPVVLSLDGYELRRLTTGRHLVNIGIAAHNCLARRVGETYLPHDVYWMQLREGTRHIFALHRAETLLAVFSIAPTDHSEVQFLAPREHVVDILTRCVPAIETATGHAVPKSFTSCLAAGEVVALHPQPHPAAPTPTPSNDNAEVG
jgi:hypothetical protein